jgi:hypothetical protein
MTKTPIKVVPSDGRHKLDHASRLNYAKVYTVEYNVKVWFIGKIHRDSEGDLIVAYNDVHPPLQAPRRPAGLASGAPSSYQAPYSQYTPASFPSVAAGYSTTPSSLQPTTTQHQTSNYATVATASYGLVQSPSYTAPTSYPEQYPSTAPADQSYRDPQLPSDTVYE